MRSVTAGRRCRIVETAVVVLGQVRDALDNQIAECGRISQGFEIGVVLHADQVRKADRGVQYGAPWPDGYPLLRPGENRRAA